MLKLETKNYLPLNYYHFIIFIKEILSIQLINYIKAN